MKKIDSKQQLAYNYIRSRIMEGIYAPGERIIIDQIGRELSLSSIPIREAIHRLKAEDLLMIKRFSGAVVSFIDENEYLEILTTLAVLEGFAATISFPLYPPGEIDKLQQINDQMKQALEDFNFHNYIILNKQFHIMSVSFCSNKYILAKISSMWEKLDTIRRMSPKYFPNRAKESVKEHDIIISLLNGEKPSEDIEQYIRNHHLGGVSK